MNRIMGFNQKYFTRQNIIAPCIDIRTTKGFSLPANKNSYIYTLMRVYRVQDFSSVVLFDDRASNIADAIDIGITAVQVEPDNLFGEHHMHEFDNKILADTGHDSKFLNRNTLDKYYEGIEFGTGVRSVNNYFMEPYDLEANHVRKMPLYGSFIGTRKADILAQRSKTPSHTQHIPHNTLQSSIQQGQEQDKNHSKNHKDNDIIMYESDGDDEHPNITFPITTTTRPIFNMPTNITTRTPRITESNIESFTTRSNYNLIIILIIIMFLMILMMY
jgi:hypothetical protein